MTARKVAIQTIGKPDIPPVILVLKAFADGWSYEVQDLSSGALPLSWRTPTTDEAEERLKQTYDPAIWTITVLEAD